MKNMKRGIALVIIALILLAALPMTGFAAEKIDPERNATLTVRYKSGETALSGAQFDVYKVADTDEDGNMTVTADFEPFSVVLDDLDQDGWTALAMRLKGEAQSKLSPMASAVVDEAGNAVFTLKPGLYLVIGKALTIGYTTYVSDPFMVFLPGRNIADEWKYDVVTNPKNTTPTTIAKIIKAWDEEYRDAWKDITEIRIDVLCDGVYDRTIVLTRENNWTYVFADGLDPAHDWSFVEITVDGFTPEYEIIGTTLKITNHYTPDLPPEELPIEKKVKGDPSEKAKFTFILTAENPDNPMPAGSNNGVKEITVQGAGVGKFGEIKFEKPGDYKYTIVEKNEGLKGYTYDSTVYTLTFHVSQGYNCLITELTIVDSDGNTVEEIAFTNKYTDDKLPQTGLLWWPVPVLLAVGLMLVLFGIVRRKGSGNEE